MESTVFEIGDEAAVKLLGDCRLPKGTRVRVHRDGDRIVIEEVAKSRTRFSEEFFAGLGTWPGEIERPRQETEVRDVFASDGE